MGTSLQNGWYKDMKGMGCKEINSDIVHDHYPQPPWKRRPVETAHSELVDISPKTVFNLVALVAGAKLNDDALSDMLEPVGGLLMVGTLGTLVDRVEWLEIEDLDISVGLG